MQIPHVTYPLANIHMVMPIQSRTPIWAPHPLSHGFVPIQIQRSRIHSQKPTRSEPSVAGPRLSPSLAVFVALMSPPTWTTSFLLSFMWQTVTSVIALRPCGVGPTPPQNDALSRCDWPVRKRVWQTGLGRLVYPFPSVCAIHAPRE